ncbi:MAG: hypothetical protein AAFQ91_04635 [Cyanobacteria bacterium J06621_15]
MQSNTNQINKKLFAAATSLLALCFLPARSFNKPISTSDKAVIAVNKLNPRNLFNTQSTQSTLTVKKLLNHCIPAITFNDKGYPISAMGQDSGSSDSSNSYAAINAHTWKIYEYSDICQELPVLFKDRISEI